MKKAIALCSTVLLFSSAMPVVSFAEKIDQSSTENEVTQETTTSESSTQESTTESTATSESKETTESSKATETTESSVEQVNPVPQASSDPIVTSTQEDVQQEVVATPTNEVTITVDSSSIHFEKNQTTEEFVTKVGEQARKVGKEKNLFSSVMIAQAILESGSGSSILSQEPYNNLFGIKGEYEGQFVSLPTYEDDGTGNLYQIDSSFRKYPTVEQSFEDYSTLLTEGLDGSPTFYQGTWKTVAKTYQNATQALTGTYATDTEYNKKLNGLIEAYNLTQYDHEKAILTPADGNFEPYNEVNYDTGNSYAWGNCTQYVYNRITQLGGHIDLKMGNGQDWGATGLAKGYEVTNTPKVGTAVSFPSGELAYVLGADPVYGHVAFLEKINSDGSLLISEMNYVGLNIVSTRIIPAEHVGMLTYITPK